MNLRGYFLENVVFSSFFWYLNVHVDLPYVNIKYGMFNKTDLEIKAQNYIMSSSCYTFQESRKGWNIR